MGQSVRHVKPPQGDRDLTQDRRRLKWRRVAAKLTIRQLSAKSGVSPGAISMLETGRRSAEVGTLAALADALNCDITDIMPAEPGANGSAA
jgi:XRE family transcriptional regulator, fatty acid utilization regulator